MSQSKACVMIIGPVLWIRHRPSLNVDFRIDRSSKKFALSMLIYTWTRSMSGVSRCIGFLTQMERVNVTDIPELSNFMSELRNSLSKLFVRPWFWLFVEELLNCTELFLRLLWQSKLFNYISYSNSNGQRYFEPVLSAWLFRIAFCELSRSNDKFSNV